MKLSHLSQEDHHRAAALAKQAQDSLRELQNLVHRAPFADRTLDVMGAVQEYLIDPLREAWGEANIEDDPYPSVGYGGPRTVRRKIKRSLTL